MRKNKKSAPDNQNQEELNVQVSDTDTTEEPEKKERKKRVKKEYPKLRKAGIIFCSIFLAGMIIASSVGLYVVKYMTDFINGDVAINLDEYKANQSQTTILYTVDDDGNEIEIARLHGEENRIWVDLEEIPDDLQKAFIALEDMRFQTHQGVDWRRTIAVMIVPKYDGQGGSTITQQLIKNLTGERDVTYVRKYREILNALNLEKHYSKETILEAYLNTLYLDAGCYGVQTASEYYFGKDVNELNLAECACIAAITQEPRANNPILNYDTNRKRMVYALDCMLRDGYITQKEYDKAIDYDLVFTTDDDYVASDKSDKKDEMINVSEDSKEKDVQSYYVDYVIDSVIEDLMEAYGYSYNEAWKMVYYGGLKIHVAVDTEIQQTLEDIYYNRKGFPTSTNSHGEQVQSCMVIMDYAGRVLGVIGQAGEKEGARCLNIATDSKRQPGSAIKPLSVYSYAIESNRYTWSYPLVQNFGIVVGGKRWPTNYGGDPGAETSFETIQQALAPSHNTVPAQILKSVGLSKNFQWLKDAFKITSLEEADCDYAPLAVGAMSHGVYAIEMCAAYATFGNNGLYFEPYCYYTVTNSSGSTVYLTHNDTGEQVMEPGTADVMNKLLQTVTTASNGTGRAFRVSGFDMFAKTGTTSDEKDRWFIGGTPYYVCSVWMGYSEYAEELDFSTNYCGKLYQTVMNEIHADLPTKSFEYSNEIVKRTYCQETGLIAAAKCEKTATGWYKKSSIPSTCTECATAVPEDPNVLQGETTKPATSSSTTKPVTPPTTTKPATSSSTTKPVTTTQTVGG